MPTEKRTAQVWLESPNETQTDTVLKLRLLLLLLLLMLCAAASNIGVDLRLVGVWRCFEWVLVDLALAFFDCPSLGIVRLPLCTFYLHIWH